MAATLATFGSLALGGTAAARPFELGLTDGIFQDPDPAVRAAWLDRAVESRAEMVLPLAAWSGIAPPSKRGLKATDPGDPAYDWDALDAAVRDAAARGLEPTILVSSAPPWAEGGKRPKSVNAGTWKPKPRALGQFGEAIARRYSGGFVDPDDVAAGALPRVTHFQLWAEPNLSIYLTPQWRGGKPFAPVHYRKMLRAFYEGVHSVSKRNRVVTGGTAPYGDLFRGGERMQPVTFWRALLCFEGDELKKRKCGKPAKFDVWAHHPINVGAPRRRARNEEDVSTPDIGKLRRIIEKARRTGRVLPRDEKPFWATEIWWDSKPPDPRGVPAGRHARFVAESAYLLWRQGAERVVWFLASDQRANGNFAATLQSGLYLADGTPKLAQRAFRFPFVADAGGKGRVRVWGVAPDRGKVSIERRAGNGWKRVGGRRAKGSHVFSGSVPIRKGTVLRAVQGGDASVPFKAR